MRYSLHFLLFAILTYCAPISFSSAKGNTSGSGHYGQLPPTLVPLHYQLTFHPYFPEDGVHYEPHQNFTFDGRVSISIRCMNETDKIIFHMKDITLRNDTIRLVSTETLDQIALMPNYEYDADTERVTVHIGQKLIKGHIYFLSMNFTGKVDPSLAVGVYPSSYMNNGRIKWVVATQFEPMDARRAFPCFDEPLYKATFQVTIVHPLTMKALTNTMQESSYESPPWRVTTFNSSSSQSQTHRTVV